MKNWKTLLAAVVLLSMSINLGMIFFWAPIESSMGIVQKIMYLHVPSVLSTYLGYSIVFIFSIGFLLKRKEWMDVIASSAAEVGTLFCMVSLITGSIWGKPTWNTYWSWDARLTSTLIMFLIFVGYLLLRSIAEKGEDQGVIAAVIGITGFFAIPLVHFSVTWWRTLHQPTTILSTKKNMISQPLAVMLLISVISFALFFLYLLMKRIEMEKAERAYHAQLSSEEAV